VDVDYTARGAQKKTERARVARAISEGQGAISCAIAATYSFVAIVNVKSSVLVTASVNPYE